VPSLLRSRGRPAPGGGRAAAVAAALAAMLGLAACTASAGGQQAALGSGQGFVAGNPGTTIYRGPEAPAVPAVSGTTLSGARLSLSAYRGHVVVLNFWGSWCTPCRSEAPALAALARRFQPAGVRFLGVDIRDNPAAARAFMSNFGITYPSLNDPGDEVALAFRATVPPGGIPTTLVISRAGRVVARVIGEASYAGLRHLIAEAAGQDAGSAPGAVSG
jgi:thiol-disulfide isomerase/thioredoxin